jgi:hypothetical protein
VKGPVSSTPVIAVAATFALVFAPAVDALPGVSEPVDSEVLAAQVLAPTCTEASLQESTRLSPDSLLIALVPASAASSSALVPVTGPSHDFAQPPFANAGSPLDSCTIARRGPPAG